MTSQSVMRHDITEPQSHRATEPQSAMCQGGAAFALAHDLPGFGAMFQGTPPKMQCEDVNYSIVLHKRKKLIKSVVYIINM